MSSRQRALLAGAVLIFVVVAVLRVLHAFSYPADSLLNVLLVASTVALTAMLIWVVTSLIVANRGRRVAATLATLRSSHVSEQIFGCSVEEGFWLALRRLKAGLSNEGPGPWLMGSFRGNFVCAIVSEDSLSYWTVESVPEKLISIGRSQIAAATVGPVPAGNTSLTGLILIIKGGPEYRLAALVEDESHPGHPAKEGAIRAIANAIKEAG